MEQIDPKLRDALRFDQEALRQTFRAAGADLPGRTSLPGPRHDFNRRVWAEYDAPQHLQSLLDRGHCRGR